MLDFAPWLLVGIFQFFLLGRWSRYPYEIPRESLITIGALVAFFWWIFNDGRLFIPEWSFYLGLGMLSLWFINGIFAQVPRVGLRYAVAFGAVVLFFALIQPGYEIVGFEFIGAALAANSLYAIAQSKLGIDFIRDNSNLKKRNAIGFIGNSNMLGCWIVPSLFITSWLAVHQHPAWWVCVGLGCYTLWLTRCRSALVGLFVGAVFLSSVAMPILLFVWLPLLIGGLASYRALRPESFLFYHKTFHERLNYWRTAFEQIRRSWLLGCGFNLLAVKVPYIQRYINIQTKGKFLNPDNYQNPWPQRCHNDYIQHTADNGILGLLGILCFAGMGIYLGFDDLLLTTALVSLLGAGLFFHTFHIISTNFLFWFLVFTAIRTDVAIMTFDFSLLTSIGICLFSILLVTRTAIKEQIQDIFLQRYLVCQTKENLIAAHNTAPYSSAVNTNASGFHARAADGWLVFRHSIRAVEHTDGAQRMWEMWANIGVACLMQGSPQLAERCFRESLSFWPAYSVAQGHLMKLEKLNASLQSRQMEADAKQKEQTLRRANDGTC